MKLYPLLLTASALGLPAVTFGQGLPALDLDLVPLGTYESGLFDESAAEIVAHDPNSQRLFIVNAFANSIDVVSIADPSHPTLVSTVDMSPYGGGLTSIDVGRGKVAGLGGVAYQPVVAVAVKADPETDPGMAVFLDTDGNFQRMFSVATPIAPGSKAVNGATPADLTNVGANGAPNSLCIPPGSNIIYVGETTWPGRIIKATLQGDVLGVIGNSGRNLGEFSGAHGLACPSEDVLFVAESSNSRAQKLILNPPMSTRASGGGE